ncbi:TKL/TKL-ccin protein kinase [Coprinopsis cinerea AmutBmut pab1-1]|nr:TKL/TKL-ccin protein kinase [Coprinopsis cinerea AmutBmut pab1-1]
MVPPGREAIQSQSFEGSRATDIVILVLGATGAGKSTFINHALGRERHNEHVRVDETLSSCTEGLHFVELEIPSLFQRRRLRQAGLKRIILVDTPGFNNSRYPSDGYIMAMILAGLAKAYGLSGPANIGAAYIYDLFSPQTNRAETETLELIKRQNWGKQMVLVTSKWAKHKDQSSASNSEKLAKELWNGVLGDDARDRCVSLTPEGREAAWQVINTILQTVDPNTISRAGLNSIDEPAPFCHHSPRETDGNLDQPPSGSRPTTGGFVIDETVTEADVIILLMGPSGVGKSTFINLVLGVQAVPVDLGEFGDINLTRKRRRLILLDTPGFDDSLINDIDILRQISYWLTKCYRSPVTLLGVIYIHDITVDRFESTAQRNLSLFKELCGMEAFDQVAIITSKWERLVDEDKEIARRRESELQRSWWRDMIQRGARVHSFRRAGCTPARDAVLSLLHQFEDRRDVVKLKIQQELVDWNQTLPQTGAGRQLRYSLREIIALHKNQGSLNPELEKVLAQFRTPLLVKLKQFLGLYRFDEDEVWNGDKNHSSPTNSFL